MQFNKSFSFADSCGRKTAMNADLKAGRQVKAGVQVGILFFARPLRPAACSFQFAACSGGLW
jgi:hypothetical protein